MILQWIYNKHVLQDKKQHFDVVYLLYKLYNIVIYKLQNLIKVWFIVSKQKSLILEDKNVFNSIFILRKYNLPSYIINYSKLGLVFQKLNSSVIGYLSAENIVAIGIFSCIKYYRRASSSLRIVHQLVLSSTEPCSQWPGAR